MKWQPIESAPRDGTRILLFGRCEWEDYGNQDDLPEIVVGEFYNDAREQAWGWPDWRATSSNPYSDCVHATHWMPLPTPPTEKDQTDV